MQSSKYVSLKMWQSKVDFVVQVFFLFLHMYFRMEVNITISPFSTMCTCH